MTNKPNYNLTPERFARARADIDRRRNEAISGFDIEIAQVDADERAAARIAERYQEDAATPPPTTGRRTKRPNTGRPYKPEENARIVGAERGTLGAVAEALDRDYPGVLKQHEILLRQHRDILLRQQREPEKPDTSVIDQTGEARRFDESLSQRMEDLAAVTDIEPSSSENSPIVEATAAPRTARPTDPRHVPARVVDGTIDNGPGRPPRVYGPGFASGGVS